MKTFKEWSEEKEEENEYTINAHNENIAEEIEFQLKLGKLPVDKYKRSGFTFKIKTNWYTLRTLLFNVHGRFPEIDVPFSISPDRGFYDYLKKEWLQLEATTQDLLRKIDSYGQRSVGNLALSSVSAYVNHWNSRDAIEKALGLTKSEMLWLKNIGAIEQDEEGRWIINRSKIQKSLHVLEPAPLPRRSP